jgi:hypothetical protein
MPEVSPDLTRVVFAKTAAGQQEIHARALGLGPLPRRLLVLIDGKRTGQELAAFVTGHDVKELLEELLEKACIEAVAPVAPVAPTAPVPGMGASLNPQAASTPTDSLEAALSSLPPAETRSAKEIEMARNFMMNTVNTVFGKNLRLSMVEAIFNCQTTQELRQVYPKWVELMLSNGVGTKRLPELRTQLLKVL